MDDIENGSQRPLTLSQWKHDMAGFSRQVADNIDRVMNGSSPDSRFTIPKLKEKLVELDEFGIRPVGDDDFDTHIQLLLQQIPGNMNTDVIRKVADYLEPEKQTEG